MTHEFSVPTDEFEEAIVRNKTFQVTEYHEDFQKGDAVILKEFDREEGDYTGRVLTRYISYMQSGRSPGIEKGYIVLGLW